MDESSRTVEVVTKYSRVANFLFLPLLSLLSWSFFYKSGFNFAENLVMNIGMYGQTSVYFLVLAVVPFLLAPGLVIVWLPLFSFLMWAYTMFVYKQFFSQGWIKSLLKGSVLYVLYTVAVQHVTKVMVYVLG